MAEEFENSESFNEDLLDEESQNKTLSPEVLKAIEGKDVFRVKIIHSSATEFCIPADNEEKINEGDYVIVPTRYGKDLGLVLGKINNRECSECTDVIKIECIASKADLEQFDKNLEKEEEAFRICKEKIDKHNLEMKLVSSHYLLGEQKLLFFFTAESRVDFRELVKDLVSVFRTRIELRQIGVRDESRVMGGIGICGRGYCCHSLTDKMKTVSIKMAKKQNLSLNSLKISGPCGRLMCCLAYEYSLYSEIKDNLPQEGMCIKHDREEYKVLEVNVLHEKIKLESNSGGFIELPINKIHYEDRKKKWIIMQP